MPTPRPISWILVRGLVREGRHWGDFPQRLREAFPGDAVTCPDLPGCGTKNREPSPLVIAHYAQSLQAEIHVLPHPRILVALSLGGMVALSLVLQFPTEVDGLALINTSLASRSPFYRRLRPGAWPAVFGTLGCTTPQAREARILGLVSNRPDRRAQALPPWCDIARLAPVSLANSVRQLMAAARFRLPPKAPAPTVPMAILTSRGDRLAHFSCSEAIARSFRAPLAIHPDAGHDLPLDAPEWVMAELRRLREKVGGPLS